jgi:hypothetical protein
MMMATTATTTEFPYTARYIRELLGLAESDFQQMIEVLALPLRNDAMTGALAFSQQEFDLIRRTWEMTKRGDEPNEAAQRVKQLYQPEASVDDDTLIANFLPGFNTGAGSSLTGAMGAFSATGPSTTAATSLPQRSAIGTSQPHASSSATNGKTSLAYLVESIASSRDTILQEMSRLLDDRLAGLDEVVVELIRCKTENESLRQKLATALKDKEKVQDELNRFKPVQFGFFKKV